MSDNKCKKYIKNADEAETWILPFCRLVTLSDNTDAMSAVLVSLNPKDGHLRHNHEDYAEILFVLDGEGEQTIESETEGKTVIIKQIIKKGDLVQIPAKFFHSTINNTSDKPMLLLAINQFNPKTKRDAEWRIELTKSNSFIF